MAFGAILGQTPILTADGITYDNSKTSGVITGNNVQDAIDETVGKLEKSIEVVHLDSKEFNGTANFVQSNYVLLDSWLNDSVFKEYFAVVGRVKGTLINKIAGPNIDISCIYSQWDEGGKYFTTNTAGEFSFDVQLFFAKSKYDYFTIGQTGVYPSELSKLSLFSYSKGGEIDASASGTYSIYGLKLL